MSLPVLKGAAYTLAHLPNMLIHNGTTQTTEKITTPDSNYLKNLRGSLRSYDEVVGDPSNQTYIGNLHYSDLKEIPEPRYKTPVENAERYSKRGEIMPEMEFLGVLSIVDVFDLVYLEENFAEKVKEVLSENEMFKDDIAKIKNTESAEWIQKQLDEKEAEGLYYEDKLIGCVERAHDIDVNLNAHVMLENLVNKASGVISLRHLLREEGVVSEDIEYVIECSEEAVGDMNQRGGGNMAKAIAEFSGLSNASGSDLRAFCGAPTHALIQAASLVKAGTYKAVAVVAGGSTAKLGMNGKSHFDKDMPLLEDSVAGLAFLVTQDDGVSPVLRTEYTGRHTVSSGSSPQAVTSALVGDALDKGGYTVEDVDVYSVEMQNPDITKPAGAGDVPTANLKMIGAIGVIRKEIERADLAKFVEEKAVVGWAPTQGHIPSGAPYLGFAVDDMTTESDVNRAMIVGKGSLFLGRMTNLFDGVSIIVERNSGETDSGEDVGNLKEVVKSEVAKALRAFAENITLEEE